MKIRWISRTTLRVFHAGIIFVLAGSFLSATAFGDSSLRWKTPKTATNAQTAVSSPKSAAVSKTSSTPALLRESQSQQNVIQQARFTRQQETPIELERPSNEAKIDTLFPEKRPESHSGVKLEPPVPGQELNLGATDSAPLEQPGALGNNGDIGVRPPKVDFVCPEAETLKPIRDFDIGIQLKTTGENPPECGMGDHYFPTRDWKRICFMWKASSLCHKPLYFEEVALERYGHTHVREGLQPIVSAAHFFLTIPLLPYKMGLNPPNECVYSLGYYRPGNCAPYMLDPLPLSIRAGLFEAAAVAGGLVVFP